MWTFIKDILAPKRCYSCNSEGRFLCDTCFDKQYNFDGFCYICKRKSQYFAIHRDCLIENKLLHGKNFNNIKIFFDRAIVLTHYRNKVIRRLILHFKFFGKKSIGNELSQRMAKLLLSEVNLDNKENFLIIPVPMFFIRRIFRGFNQSNILARGIAVETAIRNNEYLLKRSRHTRQQSKISQEKRMKNLNNAFKVDRRYLDKIDKKTIILVDDVISTGSTVNEISKLLKMNGAKKIIVLCLASN